MNRNKETWLKQVSDTLPECKWFIDRFFSHEKMYDKLLELVKEQKPKELYLLLDRIWFELPDGFNIMDRPPGWLNFLGLVEFNNEEESQQIFG